MVTVRGVVTESLLVLDTFLPPLACRSSVVIDTCFTLNLPLLTMLSCRSWTKGSDSLVKS